MHEGRIPMSAPHAILKAILEAEREVFLLAGTRHDGLAPVLAAALDESGSPILRAHGLSVAAVPHAARGVTIAHRMAVSGRGAVALVPSAQFDGCAAELTVAMEMPWRAGGSLCIVMEDDPQRERFLCPRRTAMELRMPCLEPGDVAQLREMLDGGLRLSRLSGVPVAVILHTNILRSSQTIEMMPNRVAVPGMQGGSIDAVLARRRRKPRLSETKDVLRAGRRLELNRIRALPNPGERVPVGFVTVGPCDPALAHVTEALRLRGRVPVLQLGLIHPIDETAVGRLLDRCERVVVLEPRPNAAVVESRVLEVAEDRRRRGERCASVWGSVLPPAPEGDSQALIPGEALHPSVLARKIVHLLHMIRPTVQVEARLAPQPPTPLLQPPPRGSDIGIEAAIGTLRRLAVDVDQRLRVRGQGQEQKAEPTALAIDGVEQTSLGAGRVVPVEFWSARQFLATGVAALRHAARDVRSWILLLCDFEVPDNQDIERLVRGVVPGERAERVSITTANLDDRASLRDLIEKSALANRLSVIIVRDGPPAKFDVASIERSLAEIDHAGFQPQQRLVWPAEQACLLTPPAEDDLAEQKVEPGSIEMQSEVTVHRVAHRPGGRMRFRVQPLLEQIDVIRTKPPAWIWRSALQPHGGSGAIPRLELPTPIHKRQAVWRAHIAGFRGIAPGLATTVLADAGSNMGYDVAWIHDASPIGRGRRAWAQMLFTRSGRTGAAGSNQDRPPGSIDLPVASALAPYGETDLLVGFDVHETLRAIAPEQMLRVAHRDRTAVVANTGSFTDEDEVGLTPTAQENYLSSLAAVSMSQHRMAADFANACRMWFYTDRVADIAMIGIAFQRGLIPVSLEAIEAAVARAEQSGYGRAGEAFQFGRYLATDARLLARPRARSLPRDVYEDETVTGASSGSPMRLQRTVRRMALGIRSGRWGGGERAKRFEQLLRRSLDAMPGLAETAPGRRAQRDFVTGVYRAVEWGGFEYAERYAQLLTLLYQADRGETGRALTRCAVLPLAECMLIHDPIYIASMATNAEQRRLLRQRLNIKHARGDRIERRYLTRLDLVIFDRRFRADVRTSDWPARLARAVRLILPRAWRGTRRERAVRAFMLDLVQRARYESPGNYARWSELMQHLHNRAVENRLRDMTLAELQMLMEPVTSASETPESVSQADEPKTRGAERTISSYE